MMSSINLHWTLKKAQNENKVIVQELELNISSERKMIFTLAVCTDVRYHFCKETTGLKQMLQGSLHTERLSNQWKQKRFQHSTWGILVSQNLWVENMC
jgi:hypothetical protein